MTDLNIIPGDLEALRGGADAVAEALGSAPFGDAAGYVASGMPGGRSAQVVLQACQSIDDAWAALAQGLEDYAFNIGETISAFATTEDANAVTFQNTAAYSQSEPQ